MTCISTTRGLREDGVGGKRRAGSQRTRESAAGDALRPRLAMSGAPDFSGWALKQGSKVRTWKRRFFELRGRELRYYVGQNSRGQGDDEKGRVRVEAVEHTQEQAKGGRAEAMLLVTCAHKSQLLKIKPLVLEETSLWIQKLQAAVSGSGHQPEQRDSYDDRDYRSLFGGASCDEDDFDDDDRVSYAPEPLSPPTDTVESYYKVPQAPARQSGYQSGPERPFVESSVALGTEIELEDDLDNQEDEDMPRGLLAKGNAPITVAREGWVDIGELQDKRNWKKRYAVLAGPTLTYFVSKGSGEALGSAWIKKVALSSTRHNALDLSLESGRTLGLGADSREDLIEWERAISTVLGTPVLLRAASSRDGIDFDNGPVDFAVSDRPSSYTGVFCQSWLEVKQGFGMSGWKRRYFILNGALLQERETPTSQSIDESIAVHMSVKNDAAVPEFELELMSGRSLLLRAENTVDSEAWIHALSDLVGTPEVRKSNAVNTTKVATLPSPVIKPTIPTIPTRPKTVHKTGWLQKQGGMIKTWKRRYFVLDGDTLQYSDKVGSIPLGSGIVFRVVKNSSMANALDVHFLNGRILRLAGENKQEIEGWLEALQIAADLSVQQDDLLSDVHPGEMPNKNDQHGWLLKKGQMLKTWKRRYFALLRNRLMYYDAPGGELLGAGAVFDVGIGDQRPLCLDIRFHNGRLLHVVAADDEEFNQWHGALKTASNISESFLSQKSLSQEDLVLDKEFDIDVQDEDETFLDDFEDEGEADEKSGFGMWAAAMQNKPELERESSWDSDYTSGYESDAPEPDLQQPRPSVSVPEETRGCSGWLNKQGGHVKTWKRRFFTLHGTTLKYFKSDKGSLLRSYEVSAVEELPALKFGFCITMSGGRKMIVTAESKDEYEKWLLGIWGVLADQRASLASGPPRNSGVGPVDVKNAPTSPVAASDASKGCSGWLEKEGQKFKTWKKRYFTLKKGVLMYFNDVGGDAQGHGMVAGVELDRTKPFTLKILLGKDRTMRVTAQNSADMIMWHQALSAYRKGSPDASSLTADGGEYYSERESNVDRRSVSRSPPPTSPATRNPVQPPCGRFNADDYLKNDTITNESFLRIRGVDNELTMTSGSFYEPRTYKGDLTFTPALEVAAEVETSAVADVEPSVPVTQLTRVQSDDDVDFLRKTKAELEMKLLEEKRRQKQEEDEELLKMPVPCACCVVM